jgi:hypothetical protein
MTRRLLGEVSIDKLRGIPSILSVRAMESENPCYMLSDVIGMIDCFHENSVRFFFKIYILMNVLTVILKCILVLDEPIGFSAVVGYLYRSQQHRLLAIADEIMQIEGMNEVGFF